MEIVCNIAANLQHNRNQGFCKGLFKVQAPVRLKFCDGTTTELDREHSEFEFWWNRLQTHLKTNKIILFLWFLLPWKSQKQV